MTATPTKPITPADPEAPTKPELDFERLVFFSDAVVAIAITLLALDIKLPAGEADLTNAALLSQLLQIWPKYLGFVISFLVIGLFWLSHMRLFRNLKTLDNRLIWLNLIFLMLVAFLPFPTSIHSEYTNKVSTIFYALSVTLTGLASLSMWWYASTRPAYLRQPLSTLQIRSALITPAVFLISIPVALWNANVAQFLWLGAAAAFLVRLRQRATPADD